MEIPQIIDLLNKAGLLGGATVLGFALWKRHLVLGWTYLDCQSRNEQLNTLLNAHAAKLEAKVDRLEAERDKRYGNPA